MDQTWHRRSALQALGAATIGTITASYATADTPVQEPHKPRGNIKQSICRWCYGKIPLDKLADEAVKLGFKSIELLTIEEYKQIKPFGLTCAMLGPVSIPDGLNRPQFHAGIERDLRRNIEFAAAEGLPNVICMAGNRKGMDDEEGLNNCVEGLKRFIGYAEEKKINVCMEGLNSKKLGSPRFKLLYDIYHMQIMEGDVIRTIKDNKEYLTHFHTGGVPGRHEIDETQELNYPAIVKAILATGYEGYLGQEFIPSSGRQPLTSLAQGFRICDV
jgi:hydroxypyruvate isomerase